MGILIDFQEAKAKLQAPIVQDALTNKELEAAIAQFAFSRMDKNSRISLILAGIFGGQAEDYVKKAAEVEFYAKSDFTEPYRPEATV